MSPRGHSRLLVSMRRKGGARTRALLKDKLVRIWSGEHSAWWRPNSCGYTDHVEAAGTYTFEDAWNRTVHCCAQKQIQFYVVP